MEHQTSDEKKYEMLKQSLLEIVKETPNDAILGNKIRIFSNLLTEDVILENKDIKPIDHL